MMRDWILDKAELPSRATTVEFQTAEKIRELQTAVERVIRGKSETVKFALVALLGKGHLLIEDVPGIGKTTLASAIARALDLSVQRVQFTSDLLPSDVIGISIFNQQTGDFEWKQGPIFSNIVLADEINRATPKTQSWFTLKMAFLFRFIPWILCIQWFLRCKITTEYTEATERHRTRKRHRLRKAKSRRLCICPPPA